jgi:hypothetical protein
VPAAHHVESVASGTAGGAAASKGETPCWDSAWRLPVFGDFTADGEAAYAEAMQDPAAGGDNVWRP